MIEWFECPESSTIVRVGYDDETMILTVEFKQSTYQYYDVPSHIFQEMRGCGSKGQFLAQQVKNRYRYSRA
jgi:hypothetical protein